MGVKRILVSGGSRGLGLAYCEHYLQLGHHVFTFSRRATEDWDVLASRFAGRFHSAEQDLAGEGAPAMVVGAAVEAMSGIDLLVNNAALGQDALLPHMAEEEVSRLVNVNLTAMLLLTRRVVKQMILQGGGVILNVSSICAARGYPGLTVYSATKGAIDAFTRSLATELGPLGIRVNAIAPGFFGSEMSAVLGQGQVETIARRTPTRRLSEIEEIVAASDVLIADGTNISGQVLAVDGGASIA